MTTAENTVPARHVRLQGSSNLRDIGGYETSDGARVRWGMIYRSGAMARFTDRDRHWVEARRIATVVDLRSEAEQALAPTSWVTARGARYVSSGYDATLIFSRDAGSTSRGGALNDLHEYLYSLFGELLAPSFRAMFTALLDAKVPLIVHCSAGQDRTGLAIALVLTALGIPRATIMEDFLLSTDARIFENELDRGGLAALAESNPVAAFYTAALRERGEAALRPRPLIDADGVPLLAHGLAAIERSWGSVESYLAELGVGSAEQDALRDRYLTRLASQAA